MREWGAQLSLPYSGAGQLVTQLHSLPELPSPQRVPEAGSAGGPGSVPEAARAQSRCGARAGSPAPPPRLSTVVLATAAHPPAAGGPLRWGWGPTASALWTGELGVGGETEFAGNLGGGIACLPCPGLRD